MFNYMVKVFLVVGVMIGGIQLGSTSGDAMPSSTLTAETSAKAPRENTDSIALDVTNASADPAFTDDHDQAAIRMATCDPDACDASCIARGYCEGNCYGSSGNFCGCIRRLPGGFCP